jgi:hypothetical protein
MREEFDPADYSVVVKLRGTPPKPWRWEIYCAGRWDKLLALPAGRAHIFVPWPTSKLHVSAAQSTR